MLETDIQIYQQREQSFICLAMPLDIVRTDKHAAVDIWKTLFRLAGVVTSATSYVGVNGLTWS